MANTFGFTNRKFGVEIEFLSTRKRNAGYVDTQELARLLTAAGVPTESERYNHQTRSYWKIVADSSCGLELVSPPLSGENGLEQVERASEVLTEYGCKIDRTCGLHVHHDASGLTLASATNLFEFYRHYEPAIDSLLPASRRGDTCMYAKSLKNADYESYNVEEYYLDMFAEYSAEQASPGLEYAVDRSRSSLLRRYCQHRPRYLKLNLSSYAVHGTVEFRQHSGTIDSKKIIAWIMLTQNMLEKVLARKVNVNPEKADDYYSLFHRLGMYGNLAEAGRPYESAQYLLARRRHFAKENN